MENNGGAVSRIEKKLNQKLDDGDYYEAHQIYRTLYFRYSAQGKFLTLINLLFDGSLRLLKAGQWASGIDLAILFTDILDKCTEQRMDGEILQKLDLLLSLMPTKSETVSREKFVQDAIKWSASKSGNEHGSPLLHAKFANTFWGHYEYSNARRHFLWSDDAANCALFLVDYHTGHGLKDEADLFVAQATLQLLCRKNVTMARKVFVEYISHHPDYANKPQRPPLATPLVDFVYFLLESVNDLPHTTRLQTFTILIDKYQASLNRDPSYKQYLDKIGQLYFGLPPPPPKNSGFLANLINDLMKDDDESQEDDEPDASKAGSSNKKGASSVIQNFKPKAPQNQESKKDHVKVRLQEEDLD